MIHKKDAQTNPNSNIHAKEWDEKFAIKPIFPRQTRVNINFMNSLCTA